MATELIAQAVILLISLAALAKASQYVIENAVVLARFFRISEATVGFVLISVSTSLPELSVALISSSAGEGALSVGNVIGSNIVDLTLIIGTCAFIRPLLVKRRDMMEIVRILLITSIIPLVLIYTGNLDRFGGLLLLGIFAAYVYYVSRKKLELENDVHHIRRPQALRAFLLFSGGIVGVLITSSFTVNSAVTISEMTGIAKTFLGATIIALGTSLPELAIDIQAVRRGRYSLALGDAIGSAMTNLTLVLGVTALFSPTLNTSIFLTIMLFLLAANIVLMYFMTTSNKITKKEGAMLIALYVIFLIVTSGVQISVAHLLPF